MVTLSIRPKKVKCEDRPDGEPDMISGYSISERDSSQAETKPLAKSLNSSLRQQQKPHQ
jgi:hypothetical protein